MPFRHFYLLSHYICNGLLFLFSVCWLHVNEFNSFWEELRGRGQKSTACSEDIFVMEFYLPVLTLHLQWFILFIFCVLAPEGTNAIVFGERGEGDRRLWLILMSFSLCWTFFSSFTDDKMMPQAITLHDKFIIILSQYIIFFFWMIYLSSK